MFDDLEGKIIFLVTVGLMFGFAILALIQDC
jgi:hypothetical protein